MLRFTLLNTVSHAVEETEVDAVETRGARRRAGQRPASAQAHSRRQTVCRSPGAGGAAGAVERRQRVRPNGTPTNASGSWFSFIVSAVTLIVTGPIDRVAAARHVQREVVVPWRRRDADEARARACSRNNTTADRSGWRSRAAAIAAEQRPPVTARPASAGRDQFVLDLADAPRAEVRTGRDRDRRAVASRIDRDAEETRARYGRSVSAAVSVNWYWPLKTACPLSTPDEALSVSPGGR